MPFNSSDPLGYAGLNQSQQPVFLAGQGRVPTTNDIWPPGTRWEYVSGATRVIYETTGVGQWDVGGNVQATTTVAGITRYATYAEVSTGTGTNNATLAADVYTYVNSVAIAGAPAWSTTVSGIGELATNAEAIAQAATDKALVPSNLPGVLAAPGTIGGTTPGAGNFTTLAFTTATGTAG